MAEFLAMTPANAAIAIAAEVREIVDLDPVDEVGHFQAKALIDQVGSKGLLYGRLEHPHQDGENFLVEQYRVCLELKKRLTGRRNDVRRDHERLTEAGQACCLHSQG